MYGPVNSLMGTQVDRIHSMALFTRIFEYIDFSINVENPYMSVELEKVLRTIKFKMLDMHMIMRKS